MVLFLFIWTRLGHQVAYIVFYNDTRYREVRLHFLGRILLLTTILHQRELIVSITAVIDWLACILARADDNSNGQTMKIAHFNYSTKLSMLLISVTHLFMPVYTRDACHYSNYAWRMILFRFVEILMKLLEFFGNYSNPKFEWFSNFWFDRF